MALRAMVLCAVAQVNINLGVLFEMMIMGGVYTRCLSEYNMIVSEVPIITRGYGYLISRLPPFEYQGLPVLVEG